jgi:hypothetical protein
LNVFSLLLSAVLVATGQPVRALLQGRLVNLTTMAAEMTLTERPPDLERNDLAGDFAVALLDDGRLQAYRLSTGQQLWSVPGHPPCEKMDLGTEVYELCGGNLLAMPRAGGKPRLLERDSELGQLLAFKGSIAVSNAREAAAIRPGKGRSVRRTSLSRALGGGVFVPTDGEGLCSVAVDDRAITMGCWDGQLKRRWLRTFPMTVPPGEPSAFELVRQDGPYHVIFPDRVISWRDGTVSRETAYATVEDSDGHRIDPAAVQDALSRALPALAGQERLNEHPFAHVSADDGRAYVLAANGTGRLVGFDRHDKRRLFVVPALLGLLRDDLELIAGFPVVRTKMAEGGQRQRVTIHDPATGAVLYQDERASN